MVLRYLLAASFLGAVSIASPALAQSGDRRASSMTGDARADLPEMAQTKEPAAAPPPARQGAPTAPPALTQAPAPTPPALTQAPATVAVGPHTKPAVARIASIEVGDRGCYLSIVDDRGVTTQEIADFDVCAPKEPPKGRRLALNWRIERVQAASCQGDPSCKKTDLVPMIVGTRPLN